MTSRELQAMILRLHHAESWPVGTIAKQLGIHHSAVTRVLGQEGLPRSRILRPSMVDEYLPFILEQLKEHPKLCASRLFDMVKARGYPGGPDHFRHLVAPLRPRPAPEAYLRLRTLPGEEAQVDWGHFGKVKVGRATHRLMAFVMVLSWSRMVFLRFYLGAKLENFLRGHEAAFHFFQGVGRRLLYDNLKSAVLERLGDAIRFHPTLLDFAGHYRFEPRPVAPYRGNEKGKVERAIRYVRTSFFAARHWHDLDDLNAQAEAWCLGLAADRRWRDGEGRTVREAFAEESGKLLGLPDNPFPTDERKEVSVGKTPYARFDLNDYSLPHTLTRRHLVVIGSPSTVRILDGDEVVATHSRSYDKGEEVEDPAHVKALKEYKRRARQGSGTRRLVGRIPAAEALLEELALRGDNLGAAVSALLRYADQYSPAWVEEAIQEALEKGTPRPSSVRFLLEKRQRQEGRPAPVAIQLSTDPRIQNLEVRPHNLSTYDALKEAPHEEEEDFSPPEASGDPAVSRDHSPEPTPVLRDQEVRDPARGGEVPGSGAPGRDGHRRPSTHPRPPKG